MTFTEVSSVPSVEGAVVSRTVSSFVVGAAVVEASASGDFVAASVLSSTRMIVAFFVVSWITLSAVSARESKALVVDSFVAAPSVWFAADGGTVVVSATMDVCAEESWAEPDAEEPSLWLSPFTETVSPAWSMTSSPASVRISVSIFRPDTKVSSPSSSESPSSADVFGSTQPSQ